VVDGVSFELCAGDFVVLRGPSGSGKTTVLALGGAMLSPTSGEVLLDGEATSRLREVYRAGVRRRKVGFLFQDLQLVDAMTARQNVLLPRVPDGIGHADEARALEVLERFGVGAVAHSPARALSGGERQRVALARAMMNAPPLLLLDEPTAHLDDANARTLMEVLVDLAREGRALLVATHDPRVASASSVSRVLDLAAGRLVPQGDSS
jgi:putative ABC transport system ATP-binding protein